MLHRYRPPPGSALWLPHCSADYFGICLYQLCIFGLKKYFAYFSCQTWSVRVGGVSKEHFLTSCNSLNRRSGICLGHSNIFRFSMLDFSTVALGLVSLGSLSCWKTKFHPQVFLLRLFCIWILPKILTSLLSPITSILLSRIMLGFQHFIPCRIFRCRPHLTRDLLKPLPLLQYVLHRFMKCRCSSIPGFNNEDKVGGGGGWILMQSGL